MRHPGHTQYATRAVLLGSMLAVLAWASTARGAVDPQPLDKTIELDLWGRNLQDAVSQITERSGVDIIVSPYFLRPVDFPKRTLYLEARKIRVRTSVEWLARSLGCMYRVQTPRRVRLTGSYSRKWMKEKEDILIPREYLDTLMAQGESGRDFEQMLRELVKANDLFGQDFYVRVEEHYPGGDEKAHRLVAVLPTTLKQYLETSLRLMIRPGRPVDEPPPYKAPPAEIDLLRSLSKPVVLRYTRKLPVLDIIRDISLQSGIQIAFGPEHFKDRPLPEITFNVGEVPARAAIETLARKLGFQGMELYPPSGVWLTTEPRRWTRATTRSFLWEGLSVRAFHARAIAASIGGGEVLAHHIRHRVLPDLWKDPATAVVYHRKSGNLICIAPEGALKEILRELHHLKQSTREDPPAARAQEIPSPDL